MSREPDPLGQKWVEGWFHYGARACVRAVFWSRPRKGHRRRRPWKFRRWAAAAVSMATSAFPTVFLKPASAHDSHGSWQVWGGLTRMKAPHQLDLFVGAVSPARKEVVRRRRWQWEGQKKGWADGWRMAVFKRAARAAHGRQTASGSKDCIFFLSSPAFFAHVPAAATTWGSDKWFFLPGPTTYVMPSNRRRLRHVSFDFYDAGGTVKIGRETTPSSWFGKSNRRIIFWMCYALLPAAYFVVETQGQHRSKPFLSHGQIAPGLGGWGQCGSSLSFTTPPPNIACDMLRKRLCTWKV